MHEDLALDVEEEDAAAWDDKIFQTQVTDEFSKVHIILLVKVKLNVLAENFFAVCIVDKKDVAKCETLNAQFAKLSDVATTTTTC